MSRLAYSRIEPDFEFDQQEICTTLQPLGFKCQFFETSGSQAGQGVHSFIAFHDDADPQKKLTVIAFRGTDASDPTDLADDANFLQKKWPKADLCIGDLLTHLMTFCPLSRLAQPMSRTNFSLPVIVLAPHWPPCLPESNDLIVFIPSVLPELVILILCKLLTEYRPVASSTVVMSWPTPAESLGDLKYEHYGVSFYIDRQRTITKPSDDYIDQDRAVAASEYLIEYAWHKDNVAVRELADHAPINYVTATAADDSQPRLIF